MRNKAVNKYLRSIKRKISCDRITKKIFIADLTSSIINYMEENGELSYSDLCERFGEVCDVSSQFMDSLDPMEIKQIQKKRRIYFWLLIIVLVLLVLALSLILKYNYTHWGTENIIETIIYETEPAPVNFHSQ